MLETKQLLNMSVEVAGRWLQTFLKQDSKLAMDKVEQVFTNCCADQEGMHVRVYEHPCELTSLATNMDKWGRRNKYPRLVEELRLKLVRRQIKGRVRVRVTM